MDSHVNELNIDLIYEDTVIGTCKTKNSVVYANQVTNITAFLDLGLSQLLPVLNPMLGDLMFHGGTLYVDDDDNY